MVVTFDFVDDILKYLNIVVISSNKYRSIIFQIYLLKTNYFVENQLVSRI
jgi:hypothetical protein